MADEQFGPYLLEAQVGVGGMGAVYRALDRRVPRRVALKILHPALAVDPAYRERFQRESALLRAIEHPHIVPLHEAGEIGPRLYLDMRFVEGADLHEAVATRGAMPAARAVSTLEALADALDYVHAHGVLHRDIKPRNVMLAGGRFFPYLLDFGIARAENSTTLTQAGAVAGSLEYLAPERYNGDRADRSADIYALAGVLYFCLTGRPPFTGRDFFALAHGHREGPVPRPGAVDPALAPFDAVLERGLAKDPTARPASGAVLAALAGAALKSVVTDQSAVAARWAPSATTGALPRAVGVVTHVVGGPGPEPGAAPTAMAPVGPASAATPDPASAATMARYPVPPAAPALWSPPGPESWSPPSPTVAERYPPTGAHSAPADPTTEQLPWYSWIVPVAAVLALVCVFSPWFKGYFEFTDVPDSRTTDPNGLTAWGDGKYAVLVPVLVLLAGVLVVAHHSGLRRFGGRRSIGLLVLGLGVLAGLLAGSTWFTLVHFYSVHSSDWSIGLSGRNWSAYQRSAHARDYALSRGPQPAWFLTLGAAILTVLIGALLAAPRRQIRRA